MKFFELFFRVQPHLKKCFEGIARLYFTENMEVTTMISSEGEEVKLEVIINTEAAKGQVEKWLLDLEKDMKKSVRAMVSIFYSSSFSSFIKSKNLFSCLGGASKKCLSY